MRVQRSVGFLSILLALVALAAPVAAQQGLLTGRIIDEMSGQPVDAAQVQVLGGPRATGGLTDATGVFRVQLAAGTYSIVVERVGYRSERFVGVHVNAGQTVTYDIRLTSMAVALDGVVITASRTAERQLQSPATTHIVGATEIAERSVATPVDYLRSAPGVDVITSGVQSSNVVIRGFNNIFSGALLALTDHRIAGVPSLRVNLLHFIPANSEDIERMEVVLGPGSALYGPNTANGVLHILTKSPLDAQGTIVSVAGGERSVFQGQFRSAFLVSDNLGFKVSGQYLAGNEWEYNDPVEEAAEASARSNSAACIAGLKIRGYNDTAAAGSYCARVGVRDFDIRRYGFEARADYRLGEDGSAVVTYGRTVGNGIELTGLGAAQTGDWAYAFYQARMSKGRFFGQMYSNTSDAGATFLLRDGVPLVDKSKLLVGQLRHGFTTWGDRQDFTYGVDYVATRPATEGTINGSYEDEDNMKEVGAYLQSKTALAEKIDLILAGRVDKHNMLPDPVYSPRAALVFKPTDEQSLRVTYNRAFSTPSSLNFFLDISGGAAPAPLGSMGYTTRAFGTGKAGFSFKNADGTLKGMRSPFNPAGRDQLVPTSAASNFWTAAVQVAAAGAAAKGTPLPASLVQLLMSLRPTSAQVGISLLDAGTSKVGSPADASFFPGVVPGIRESYTESFEAGWQGIIDNRLRLSVDVYREKKNDFVSPLVLQTPLVLLNGAQIGAFIGTPLGQALIPQYMAAGMTLAQAQAAVTTLVTSLATAIGSVPVGVVSSPEVAARGADLIVTYLNVGDVSLWGADLGFSWFVNDQWTLSGNYSHVSEDYFKYGTNQYISLNAPKAKTTLGLAYRNARSGFNADGRVRYTGEFPAESAGYVGTKCLPEAPKSIFQEDCVGAATLVDLNLGYQIPKSRATVQLSVTNLFNVEYRSFVGVPNIGRFAMLRMKYDLF
ncbi:MAG: TonB-dependent receptor [Longimicrobiales bacterium]|nr:TonB-dependent receptor [Longimicrobiales bacterium]